MKYFLTAYKNTIASEGGYVNDPDDKGGETYRGISRKNWPKWEGWEIIDIIKKHFPSKKWDKQINTNPGIHNFVKEFYYENFWLSLKLDVLHEQVAIEMFDTAVNQGKYAAATYFQKALNKLNRNQKDYPDMMIDGKIGPTTLNAYKKYIATQHFISRNEKKLINWLVRWLNYYQLKKYDSITNHDLSQEKYIPGWTERT